MAIVGSWGQNSQCLTKMFSLPRLAAAQIELDAVMATLKEKQDSLAAVEEKVLHSLIYYLSVCLFLWSFIYLFVRDYRILPNNFY